jgi:integrase
MMISQAFRRLARRLGLGDLRFHDLRHDLGTRLARNRQSQRVIMSVLSAPGVAPDLIWMVGPLLGGQSRDVI